MKATEAAVDRCRAHGRKLRYWCPMCRKLTCEECLCTEDHETKAVKFVFTHNLEQYGTKEKIASYKEYIGANRETREAQIAQIREKIRFFEMLIQYMEDVNGKSPNGNALSPVLTLQAIERPETEEEIITMEFLSNEENVRGLLERSKEELDSLIEESLAWDVVMTIEDADGLGDVERIALMQTKRHLDFQEEMKVTNPIMSQSMRDVQTYKEKVSETETTLEERVNRISELEDEGKQMAGIIKELQEKNTSLEDQIEKQNERLKEYEDAEQVLRQELAEMRAKHEEVLKEHTEYLQGVVNERDTLKLTLSKTEEELNEMNKAQEQSRIEEERIKEKQAEDEKMWVSTCQNSERDGKFIISEPHKINELELIKPLEDNISATVCNELTAIYAYTDNHYLQVYSRETGASCVIKVDGFTLAGFLDNVLFIATERKKLRKAHVEDLFNNPRLETFETLDNSEEIGSLCEMSCLSVTRTITYISTNKCVYSYAIDSDTNTKVDMEDVCGIAADEKTQYFIKEDYSICTADGKIISKTDHYWYTRVMGFGDEPVVIGSQHCFINGKATKMPTEFSYPLSIAHIRGDNYLMYDGKLESWVFRTIKLN